MKRNDTQTAHGVKINVLSRGAPSAHRTAQRIDSETIQREIKVLAQMSAKITAKLTHHVIS